MRPTISTAQRKAEKSASDALIAPLAKTRVAAAPDTARPAHAVAKISRKNKKLKTS